MTTYYLDTSIAYHALIGTPGAAEWFDRTDNETPGSLISSRLLRTELTRALRRDGTPVQDRDAVLDKVAQVHPPWRWARTSSWSPMMRGSNAWPCCSGWVSSIHYRAHRAAPRPDTGDPRSAGVFSPRITSLCGG